MEILSAISVTTYKEALVLVDSVNIKKYIVYKVTTVADLNIGAVVYVLLIGNRIILKHRYYFEVLL
jgi:hypothetical protein